jgi:hypothetical protein
MKQNNFSIYFIFIAIFSFIAIFTSIVQNSYQNLMTPLNKVKEGKIEPMNIALDIDVISQIESREEISLDPNILIKSPSIATSTPVATPSISPLSP